MGEAGGCTCEPGGALIFLGHYAPDCPERRARFKSVEFKAAKAVVDALEAAHISGTAFFAGLLWNEQMLTGVVRTTAPEDERGTFYRFVWLFGGVGPVADEDLPRGLFADQQEEFG